MEGRLRIGIVGARGIGKHHAKWFALAGCELAAIYGTTPASAERAAAAVRELVPFSGRVFNDWTQFVAEGEFDAASVCSPADAHRGNVLDLLRSGKHVLCEKPLVWDWDAQPADLVGQGSEMVSAAHAARRVLAVNAQYPAGLPAYRELYRQVFGEEAEFPRLSYFMETKGQPRSPHGPAEVWVDLGPHPLAFLDAVSPGTVRWNSLREQGQGMETHIGFDWETGERVIPVEMTLRRVPGGTPDRRISNGRLEASYEGRNLNGEFVTVLRAEGREWVGPDFMKTSVERFIGAALHNDPSLALVTGEAGLRQLEVLAGVWMRCWRRD